MYKIICSYDLDVGFQGLQACSQMIEYPHWVPLVQVLGPAEGKRKW